MLACPEPGTREHCLLWLASKPAEETYRWGDFTKCAAAQYAVAIGVGYISGRKITRELNRLAAEADTFGELYELCHKAWTQQ